MIENNVPARGWTQSLSAHWRGHAFLFDAKSLPAYSASAGVRLLLIFIALEGILGPRLALFQWLRMPIPPFWLRVPILLCVSLLLVRFVAGVKLSQIGLRPWHDWSRTEKSYFVQVLVIANVVFLSIFADRLQTILGEPALAGRIATVFLPYFLWGIYQELMYRGILQTELVRRWGPVRGILVSNSLFTFGPLHFYHFTQTSPALPMFAGIFATGLFFAVMFHQSGNLWMAATFHGIGNVYIDGTSQGIARAGQGGSASR
jgi:membrane protease YdiL (CAAX protease family)